MVVEFNDHSLKNIDTLLSSLYNQTNYIISLKNKFPQRCALRECPR